MPYRLLAPFILFITLLFSALTAQAGLSQLFGDNNSSSGASDFLPVEQAFLFNGRASQGKAQGQAYIDITVAPGHYLYKHQFSFTPAEGVSELGTPVYPVGEEIYDPYYQKNLETFSEDLTIQIPISFSGAVPEITIKYQGCAKAGLCYPPSKITLPLTVEASPDSSLDSGSANNSDSNADIADIRPNIETDESFYQQQIGEGLFLGLALFLLAGIGLSFTPCVLPMFPILTSLILGESERSKARVISLTMAYILSMSLTFAIAGTLTGVFGASLNLQAQLQSPWLLYPMAILFVILALSMFGLYELQLPDTLRSKLSSNDTKQGSLSGAVTMGIFSALVVSPCVSAPLAGALVYISTTGDAVYGGLSLLALGLGMGIPLLLVALGGRHLLPKAGGWMNSVRGVFGVLLLGVSIWMLERVIPASLTLLLWGVLFTGSAVFLGALRFSAGSSTESRAHQTKQAAGVVLLIYGTCLIIGAAMGNGNPLKPLERLPAQVSSPSTSALTGMSSGTVNLIKVSTVAEMNQLLRQAADNNRPAMVDFYADWCITCKVMERNVFPDPLVIDDLARLTLIKLDITENTTEHQQLLNEYQLFGPPALLFFNSDGQEVKAIRTQGDITATKLKQRLDRLLTSN